MNYHTRPTRFAIGTREHFDWSATGDGLREMEPCLAEEMPLPLSDYRPSWALYVGVGVLAFLVTIIGVSA